MRPISKQSSTLVAIYPRKLVIVLQLKFIYAAYAVQLKQVLCRNYSYWNFLLLRHQVGPYGVTFNFIHALALSLTGQPMTSMRWLFEDTKLQLTSSRVSLFLACKSWRNIAPKTCLSCILRFRTYGAGVRDRTRLLSFSMERKLILFQWNNIS